MPTNRIDLPRRFDENENHFLHMNRNDYSALCIRIKYVSNEETTKSERKRVMTIRHNDSIDISIKANKIVSAVNTS